MLDLILSLLFAVLSGALSLWLVRSELALMADGGTPEGKKPPEPAQADKYKTEESADGPKTETEPGAEESPDNEEEEKSGRAARKGFSPPLIVLLFLSNIGIALFRHYYYHSPALETISLLLLLGILWASALTDYRWFRIPNRYLLIGLVARCAVFAAVAITAPLQIKYVLLRSVIAAAALLLVSLLCRLAVPKSLGFGDVKLLALMGLFLELNGIWGAAFFTMLVSFVVSLALLIAKKVNRKSEIPFAPFLLIGTILSSFLTYF